MNGDDPTGGRNSQGFDDDDLMGHDHVISREQGNQIRNERSAQTDEKDSEFGSDTDLSKSMLDDMLNDTISSANKQGNPLTDAEKKSVIETNNKFKRIMDFNKKGIIDWKSELRDFMVSSTKIQKGRTYLKNPLVRSRVGIHPYVKSKSVNKGVIYIDTSGSAIGFTKHVAGEIFNLCTQLKIENLDVMTFDDVITGTHKGLNMINADKLLKDITASGGGTDVQQVYAHIEKNYTINGTIKPDVEFIIIFSDDSGMDWSGSIAPFKNHISDVTWGKIMYIIYVPYKEIFSGELTSEYEKYISPRSKHIEIGRELLKKYLNESMVVNEGIADKIKKKRQDAIDILVKDKSELTDDERIERERSEKVKDILGNRKNDARRLSQGEKDFVSANDEYFGKVKSIINKHFPDLQEDPLNPNPSKGKYYITDDVNVRICIDIDNSNYNTFAQMCEELYNSNSEVEVIIGNVCITNLSSFYGFCKNFPKRVLGKLTLRMLRNMKSFNNAPIHVIEADVNTNKLISKQQLMYIKKLKDNGAKVRSLSTSNFTGESVKDEVNKRIRLAESYISEAIAGGVGKMLLPSYRNIGKSDAGKSRILQSTRNHNQEIFNTLLTKEYNIDWGNLKDDDFSIIDDTTVVRATIESVLKGSAVESVKRYNKIAKSIEALAKKSDNDSKKKQADIISNLKTDYVNDTLYNLYATDEHKHFQSRFKEGLRIFTDRNNNITMVLLVSKDKIGGRNYNIVCLSHNGNVVTDPEKIETFIRERREKYLSTISTEMEYFKIDNDNIPGRDKTIKEFLLRTAVIISNKYLGVDLYKRDWASFGYVDPNVRILSNEYNGAFKNLNGREQCAYKILSNLWGMPIDDIRRGYNGGSKASFSFRRSSVGNISLAYIPNDDKTTRKFVNSVADGVDVASMFSKRFLKFIVNCLDVYNANDVEHMSTEELINIVNSAANVKLEDTLLCKLMGISALKDDFQFSAITLFADKAFKLIDVKLPYDLVKQRSNEMKLYRDMLDKEGVDDKNVRKHNKSNNTKKDIISTYSNEELVSFLVKNKTSIEKIMDVTGESDKLDAIKKFINETSNEYIEDIKSLMDYVSDCLSKPDLKSSIKGALENKYNVTEFNDTLSMLLNVCKASLNKAKTILKDDTDADIVRYNVAIILDDVKQNLSDIIDPLSAIIDNTNVTGSLIAIDNIFSNIQKTYKDYVMKRRGSIDNVVSSIRDRRAKYTPSGRRVMRRAQAPEVNKETKVSNFEFGDIQNDFDSVIPDFVNVIENVDVASTSHMSMDKQSFNGLVDNINEYINVINEAINDINNTDNNLYAKTLSDIVNNIISTIKSIIDNRNNDDNVVELSNELPSLVRNLRKAMVTQRKAQQTA